MILKAFLVLVAALCTLLNVHARAKDPANVKRTSQIANAAVMRMKILAAAAATTVTTAGIIFYKVIDETRA